MGYCEKYSEKYGQGFYVLFRVLIGLMFLLHGVGKLTGANANSIASFMGLIGLLELLVGGAVLLGIFTRLGATIGAVIMLGALIQAHFPQGINIMTNGGEKAVLYLVAFLVMTWLGSGKWSLEKWLWKKETF